MKKQFLSLVIGLSLLAMGGLANALTIDGNINVGGLDELLAENSLGNSGDPVVTAWVNKKLFDLGLGDGFVITYKYDVPDQVVSDFHQVYDGTQALEKTYAYDLVYDTEYFLLKLGIGGTSVTSDHFLFKNLFSLNYAVFSFAQMGFDVSANNVNIGRVSHVSEIGSPIPEPTTTMLVALGAIGFAGIARRRLSNK